MSGEEEIIVTIDMNELKKMKVMIGFLLHREVCTQLLHLQVPELKKKVAELGLSTKGTKAELLARVEKYIREQGLYISMHVVQVTSC